MKSSFELKSDFYATWVQWICGLFFCLALFSCTLTLTTTHHHATGKSASVGKSKGKTVLVSPEWVNKYKALEAKFGYDIPADEEIKLESKGQGFRVPQAVINHFGDMTKAQ
jgi:hypothetical protein